MTTYEQILANISSVLPTLSNVSTTAIYKKIASAIGGVLDIVYTELINTKTVITNIISNQRYGKRGYLIAKALEFQYDANNPQVILIDPLTLEPYYETVDESLRIIEQCSFKIEDSEGYQLLTMKVNKKDPNTNQLVKLTTLEMASFESWMESWEVLGIPIRKKTLDADTLRFNMKVVYYSGYDLIAIQNGVNAALLSFRDNFQLDSTLYINDIEDYVKQNTPGVRAVIITNPTIKPFSSTVVTPITNGVTDVYGGHFNYDSGNTLTYETIS